MVRVIRCPSCRGADLTPIETRLRCPKCGKEFTHHTAWVKLLVTSALIGALVAICMNFLAAALGLARGTIWQWLLFGLVIGVVASWLSRRFRTLRNV